MNAAVQPLDSVMSWDASSAEDKLFRATLLLALTLFLVLGTIMPMLQLPELIATVRDEPQVLARVVLEEKVIEQREILIPEPAPVKPEPKSEPEPEPVKPEPVVRKPEPVPEKPIAPPEPVDPLAEARKAAEATGVLAFKDDLAALRDSVDVNSLNQAQTSRGASAAQELQRSIVTSGPAKQSGGIQTAALSTDTGGPALSGRETTRVKSNIGGTAREPSKRDSATTSVGGRSDEEIRRIMDKNKGAIFAIYNRALRQDPLLEGKLVFEMLIDPNGKIVELKLLSSDLASDELTRKILSRINVIDFGAASVMATRVNYSFDFLPYT